jgi:hypothetical protein
MPSKLDVALVVACLSSGVMALEARTRIDITPEPAPVRTAIACYLEPIPPAQQRSPFEAPPVVAFDATVPDMRLVCSRSDNPT